MPKLKCPFDLVKFRFHDVVELGMSCHLLSYPLFEKE
jgi:hypothetical protein